MNEDAERAALLARALEDYEVFSRSLLRIVKKSGERVRLRWNPAQQRYNLERSWRDCLLKGRQVGMTSEAVGRDEDEVGDHEKHPAGAHAITGKIAAPSRCCHGTDYATVDRCRRRLDEKPDDDGCREEQNKRQRNQPQKQQLAVQALMILKMIFLFEMYLRSIL